MKTACTWRISLTLLLGLFINLSLFGQVGPKIIGYVSVSSGASQNGVPIPNNSPILDGDLLVTSPIGHAIARFKLATQVTINQDTSVRFRKTQGGIAAELSAGALEVEQVEGKGLVVDASNFEIGPDEPVERKFYVAVMSDESIYIEARQGAVRITQLPSGRWYLLTSGTNAMIPHGAGGVPGLQARKPSPSQPRQKTTYAEQVTPPAPQTSGPEGSTNSTPSGVSRPNTGLIVGGGAAAAVAAVVALAAGGGGGGHSVSPSSP